MRTLVLVVVLGFLSNSPVFAQSATQGPLAAPESPAKPAKVKHRRATKTARRDATRNPAAYDRGPAAPDTHPVGPVPGTPIPADPVDFGMKWNGSNDSARDTRVQNYDGNAQGTGAEVGMKLHF